MDEDVCLHDSSDNQLCCVIATFLLNFKFSVGAQEETSQVHTHIHRQAVAVILYMWRILFSSKRKILMHYLNIYLI
jgi:hypothetical protein